MCAGHLAFIVLIYFLNYNNYKLISWLKKKNYIVVKKLTFINKIKVREVVYKCIF